MAETGTKTPRERYRTQVRAEIKERAWEQMASAGASALSLNAIAKGMGMSGPALYRYFAGRDELMTELIRDSYRSLADAFGVAAASGPDVAALAHALRDWALADPQRYFLVYGTPVPGYHAPADITGIAAEIMAALLDACTAPGPGSATSGPVTSPSASASASAPTSALTPPDGATTAFHTHLEDHRQWAEGHPAPVAALRRALAFWTRLHGVLSLELAGHFAGMTFDPALLFEAELESLSPVTPG